MLNYIRFFEIESDSEDFNKIVERIRGTLISLRETKQKDVWRIEGPLSEKRIIDQIVNQFDRS